MTDRMGTASVEQGIRWQAEHCLRNDAPITGRICMALLALLRGDTATGRRIAAWPGAPVEDAMPLRLAAGFHYLRFATNCGCGTGRGRTTGRCWAKRMRTARG